MPFYLAGLIMSAGFFMMYLIEELVHLYIDTRNKKNTSELTRTFSIRRHSESPNIPIADLETAKPLAGNQHGHSHNVADPSDDTIVGALRGLLIVLALSIHELFEGLAVGLESSVVNVWYVSYLNIYDNR
jgi:solute carrier family 39 (zinc transporter), member 1/2/3